MRLSTILTITIALLFALIGCNRRQSAQPTAQPSAPISPLHSPTVTPSAAITAPLELYRDKEGTLWLQSDDRSAQQQVIEQTLFNPSLCPPMTLLPRVEFQNMPSVDGGPSVVTMEHLRIHQCLQHPTTKEVWFNTSQPLAYGAHYNSDLWRYFPHEERVEQLLTDGQGSPFIQFSPDGQYLILGSDIDIKLLRADGNDLRQLFEFPKYAICSEVNVWVVPLWLADSSGVVVKIPQGCTNAPGSWPVGWWWLSLDGDVASILGYRVGE